VSEPTIALVFTPDQWVEEVHRHCTDHGGARVRQVLIEAALALEEEYDVLVVSHRWAALTHGLVDDLHARGRLVLGVYDRDELVGRDLLDALGVDATVASDGGPAGIVTALRILHGDGTRDGHRARVDDAARGARAPVVVVAGPAGAGSTEIAISLVQAMRVDTVLVDADDVAPGIAARLGLPIEPNLRTAIDAVEHADGALDDQCVALPGGTARVLTGLPSAAAWSQLRPPELLRVVERFTLASVTVVADVAASLEDLPVSMARPRNAVARALVAEGDAIVAVGEASPVGVGRLLQWMGAARRLAPRTPMHAVLNRVPANAFKRGELVDEIAGAYATASVSLVPYDRRVVDAAWDGVRVRRGPFVRAVHALATRVDGALAADSAGDGADAWPVAS
jgi:CO dehydrogenase nickel-insertion accessory protein CooC1